jgi:uncharacterized membrane protein YoaK (UPF0700 family)
LKTNMLVAAILAWIAGFVNSGGFVMIHSYTSHVTGSIGRFAQDLAEARPGAGFSALFLAVTFFGGAVATSMILDQSARRVPMRYAQALGIEAATLVAFVFVAGLSPLQHPRLLDAEAALLCVSMGMQNALVTRLSGAIVRTTHLTGVVTDLGIEAARWFRYHQASLRAKAFANVVLPERPSSGRVTLLSAIVAAFIVGAVLGAVFTFRVSRWAMLLPAAGVGALAAFAVYQTSLPPLSQRPPAPSISDGQ